MAEISEKIRQSKVLREENKIPYARAVVLMSLFTFTFLGAEFLFVNIIARTASGNLSVNAQNYVLGISALGFLLYPLFNRISDGILKTAISLTAAVISVTCLFILCRGYSYPLTLCFGLLLFLLLGSYGGAVYCKSLYLLETNAHLARLVGISYMLGTVLQIANNNLIRSDISEACVLSAFIIILAFILIKTKKSSIEPKTESENRNKDDNADKKDILKTGVVLIFFVALMTCIFSTLDNAVTLYHVSGVVNIGQWPRVLLALSGLAAGFLFDISDRKYMSIIMYCVMILSTVSLVILQFAGPFTIGLIVFYLSAGFFAVFFTASFMEIARYTKTTALWAGLGRTVNNLVAVAISGGSLAILNSGNNIAIITTELLLFVLTSIAAIIYTNSRKEFFEKLNAINDSKLKGHEKLQKLSEQFSLTPRETEVFGLLVSTEDGLQAIADKLYVSRRTLERYVSAIYEKTGAKSRIGLISLYNSI